MTLALNPQRPLSGNNTFGLRFLSLFLIALVFASCDPSKRTQKTPTKPTTTIPSTPKDVDIVKVDPTEIEIDTVKVDPIDIPSEEILNIPPGPEGAMISLMMPFLSDQFYGSSTTLPKNSDWGMSYYAGLRLGLEELEKLGHNAVVHVFDTKANAGATQRLFEDLELQSSHALIAPYLTKNVRAAATPAKASGIPFVVPFSAASKLASEFPRMLQMQPGLLKHMDGMAAYLNDNFDPEQVVLVGLPTGEQDQEVRYLLRQQKVLDPKAKAWRTWKLETADMGLQDLMWEDKFLEDKQTVFVFPVYKKPKVVLSFLSQLQIGRAGRDATVFGMPQWKEFQQLDPAIMEDLGVLITSGFHMDNDEFAVRQFEDSFINRYGAFPELPAYLGYDAIRYIVPLANKYGRNWTEHLPKNFKGLSSDYRLIPVFSSKASSEEEAKADRFENAAVKVLQYRGFGFKVID
ncbi:MAG: ABC transporter substrate-binding protein [Saprospiraceae bacterium]